MTQVFQRRRKKSSQGSIGPYNTPNNCKPETDFQQNFTFHICSNHVLISDITSLKRQVQRQERTGHFHVNSKKEWNKLYDGVNIRAQINRQITQELRQWHKSSIEAEKNISQGSTGPYNTPKQLWTGKKIEQKSSLSIMFDRCVIPKHHKHKTPDAETGENRSLPRQLQRGVEHVLRWCESSSAEQPTVYTRFAAMTKVFHSGRKNISQGSIGPYNTPNNCKPETDFQQKFSFHICSNHVLISDITSLKRQVQRQDRTEQFHVKSKEEWNKLYDGEYSSAEQPTIYTRLAAMTQVFHRSRKKYLTRKHWTLQHAKTTVNREKCPSKISPLKYIWPMCYSHTSQAKNVRCRDRREQVTSASTPKRSGTCFTMVWIIECRASDITQDLRQWHKSSIEAEKNISQGSIGPYNTPKQPWTGRKIEQKISLSIMFEPCVNMRHHKLETPGAETRENRSIPR